MVSVVFSAGPCLEHDEWLDRVCVGLSDSEAQILRAGVEMARQAYGTSFLGSGEGFWPHAQGVALIATGLKLDAEARLAALLFGLPFLDEQGLERIEDRFGSSTARLVDGVFRLNRLRPITQGFMAAHLEGHTGNAPALRAQVEVLRKMFLAMVEDIRVVLLRLASRTQTLRFYAANPNDLQVEVAHETLEIYSPLANRLGVWELKWELEDLSFRFIHPETYHQIARLLDETRGAREDFIRQAIQQLEAALGASGIQGAEMDGRPKHLYSIWKKMRQKHIPFSSLYDIRALRVIVDEVADCYAVLGIVHQLWVPIPHEFEDYISNPKSNQYQSLHTVVQAPDGRTLEVQIRTRDMHRHAELGIAAHWRYKEGLSRSEGRYDEKIAWLRQLVSWKDETAGPSDWVQGYKRAALDETIYVMTPQGKVVDLPEGATPVDFAYRVHTDLGHRCRGARVDGALLPLNTPLKTGQQVEIVTTREGGPSRDWMNPELGYIQTKSARSKVRQWFSARLQETVGGRADSETRTAPGPVATLPEADEITTFFPRVRHASALAKGSHAGQTGVLIVGIEKLLTQLARCCKPAPPDAIEGFVTRGKGVSIHRASCRDFIHLAALHPERVIETAWGDGAQGIFPVDLELEAQDRPHLLRDISDALARDKIQVTAVNMRTREEGTSLSLTVAVSNGEQIQKVIALLQKVESVRLARRV